MKYVWNYRHRVLLLIFGMRVFYTPLEWNHLHDIVGVSTPPPWVKKVGESYHCWRPTLESDRGQEQEGEGPRRGRRGWWRPRRWCPPRRGSCPPGGWRGWCRGSSTFRRI